MKHRTEAEIAALLVSRPQLWRLDVFEPGPNAPADQWRRRVRYSGSGEVPDEYRALKDRLELQGFRCDLYRYLPEWHDKL